MRTLKNSGAIGRLILEEGKFELDLIRSRSSILLGVREVFY